MLCTRRLVIISFFSGIVLTCGCTTENSDRVLCFEYSDFGPQVIAHPLIGFQWYQWDSHGYEDDNYHYNIRVIVYDDPRDLERVRAKYPTVKDKTDCRYVCRSDAIAYIEQELSHAKSDPDSLPDHVCETLKSTLNRLRWGPSSRPT